jgi:hypothetical protein
LILCTERSTSRDPACACANTSEICSSGAGGADATRFASRFPWIIDMMLGSLMVHTQSTPWPTIGSEISVNRAKRSTASGFRQPSCGRMSAG